MADDGLWEEAVSQTADDLGVRIARTKVEPFAEAMRNHQDCMAEMRSYGVPSSSDLTAMEWQPKIDAEKSARDYDLKNWMEEKKQFERRISDLEWALADARADIKDRRI